MIMKHGNTTFLPLAVLVLAVVSSCVETDGEVPELSSRWYHGVADSIAINGDNTDATLEVKSECGWQLSPADSWLAVSATSGSGNATVTVRADGPNPSHENVRRGSMVFTTIDGVKKRISVVQGPSSFIPIVLTVSPQTLAFDAINETASRLNIQSNTGWVVSADQPWVVFSPTSGDGNAEIQVRCLDNLTTQMRTCTLTVASGDTRRQVAITQQPAVLPTLSAPLVLNVGETEAGVTATIAQGTLVATEYGFYWGTSPNPVTDGQKCKASESDGKTFAATLQGLAKKQLYYVCAYAVTPVGTAYGQAATFTTLSLPHEGDNQKPDF